MSFPPRFGMPPMTAGPFVSVPYGLPMVPVVQATHYIVPTIPSGVLTTAGPRPMKKKFREHVTEKPPVTTVFVGNIHEKASNDLMRALLQKCGNVIQWKRVHGSNNKFQAFGFCEFDHPESTLRAIRLLNDLSLAEKKLVVKCDGKTLEVIKDFINKCRHLQGRPPVQSTSPADLAKAELSQQDELSYKRAMLQIVHDLGDEELAESASFAASDIKYEPDPTKTNPDAEVVDKERKEYIAREIHQFRSTHKDDKGHQKTSSGRYSNRQSGSKSPSPLQNRAASRSSVSRDDVSSKQQQQRSVSPKTGGSGPPGRVATPGAGSNGGHVTGQTGLPGTSPVSSRASSLTRSRASMDKSVAPPDAQQPHAPNSSLAQSKSSAASFGPGGGRPMDKDRGVGGAERDPAVRDRDRHHHHHHHHKHSSSNRRRESSRESGRSANRMKRRSRSRSRSRRRDSEEDEELLERKRIERKIREKEYAYQERLRKWEARERKKAREYEKYREIQKDKRKEEKREGKKLKEFFEDYDDETEDPKYYRGKSYDLRRRDYDRERDLDNKDRQKEKDELDDIRQKLLNEGVDNPDEEIRKMQKDQEEKLLKRLRAGSTPSASPTRSQKDEISSEDLDHVVDRNEKSPSADRRPMVGPETAAENVTPKLNEVPTSEEPANKQWKSLETQPPQVSKGMGFAGLKLSGPTPLAAGAAQMGVARSSGAAQPASSSSQGGGAQPQESSLVDRREYDDDETTPKKPLVPLEYSEEENQALLIDPSVQHQNMTVEEKRKAIKALIEKIPTNKEELFAYPISWPLVDANLIEKRLKPWVNKKIVEYIGEEEPSLVEFICQKVSDKSAPQGILEDISMVLDDEASVFVVKLWRLLIYEIEAKRYGLVKPDS